MKRPRERQTVTKTSAVSRGIFLPETCPGLLCLFRHCLRHKTGIPPFSTLFFLYFSKVFTSPFTFAKYSSASFSSPALPLVPSVMAFFTSSIWSSRHNKLQDNLVGIFGIQDWQASFSRNILDLTDSCIIGRHLKRYPMMFLDHGTCCKSGLDSS